MNRAAPEPLILWRFSDGRRGHDAQSRGLCEALARRRPVQTCELAAVRAAAALGALLRGRFPPAAALPDPDLLIGTGHGTHLGLLAARRARGGHCVVLMRPSLPAALFDLCLVPEHDAPVAATNLIITRGPLNRVRAGAHQAPGPDLVLVGGGSRHFRWSDAVLAQIGAVLAQPGEWLVTDSPRTPAAARTALRGIAGDRYRPWERQHPDWLAEALPAARRIWVSADSLSMLHEALSTGAAVGLLELPPVRAEDRLARAVARLCAERLLTRYSDWQGGQALAPPPAPLAEADRCAALLLERMQTWH